MMSAYYQENHLKANQSKTQLCSFHLNNKQAKRQLKVTWDGLELENHPYPVYLGVNLDRKLSCRKHIIRLKSEISTRNNLLRKLTSSKWGADPNTIRVSALGLCYSVAEYACSTWSRSCHTQKIDTSLNETCRIITGCIKTTPRPCLHALAGIAPPDIRSTSISNEERTTVEIDERHLLFSHQKTIKCLRSRKSFMDTTQAISTSKKAFIETLWLDRWNDIGVGQDPGKPEESSPLSV